MSAFCARLLLLLWLLFVDWGSLIFVCWRGTQKLTYVLASWLACPCCLQPRFHSLSSLTNLLSSRLCPPAGSTCRKLGVSPNKQERERRSGQGCACGVRGSANCAPSRNPEATKGAPQHWPNTAVASFSPVESLASEIDRRRTEPADIRWLCLAQWSRLRQPPSARSCCSTSWVLSWRAFQGTLPKRLAPQVRFSGGEFAQPTAPANRSRAPLIQGPCLLLAPLCFLWSWPCRRRVPESCGCSFQLCVT